MLSRSALFLTVTLFGQASGFALVVPSAVVPTRTLQGAKRETALFSNLVVKYADYYVEIVAIVPTKSVKNWKHSTLLDSSTKHIIVSVVGIENVQDSFWTPNLYGKISRKRNSHLRSFTNTSP